MGAVPIRRSGPGRWGAESGRPRVALVVVTTLLCALTLGLGYANKARCVGPEFDSMGRSGPDYTVRVARDVCYSDIQQLWSAGR